MKRILIDLTDIESWHGHHGGTQRVLYGIAKQFHLREDKELQVEFIAFSPRDNLFYKTSFAPIFNRTEQQSTGSPNQQAQPLAVTLKSRVKQFVRPYVPEKLRRNKYARSSAKHALLFGRSIAGKAKQKIHRPSQSLRISSPRQKITFTENDIVLVLGKPWDNPNMERVLINAKADKGFMLVQVIYDLIIPLYPHLHHPSLFKTYTQYMFEAIYSSDLLLPISKCTEKDIVRFAKSLNLPMPKTKVIRLADEITSTRVENSKPDMRIADKFIACIGTVEIRKNHTLLYYAYKLAESHGIELPQLVIVGSRGWLTGDLQYLIEHDPNVKNKILILDNINDQGLSWMYANCLFSVYPSFYEGWGLPIAEALSYGKVCISSKTSSMAEIAGDLIDYFSPYDVDQCLETIKKYLDPKVLREKEVQIQKNYKVYSWDTTYEQTSKIIERVHSDLLINQKND